MSRTYGPGGRADPPRPVALVWYCPVCEGTADWGDGSCLHCHGYGFVDHDGVEGWDDPRPAPRPPAVMKRPCGDCAYLDGSPEREWGDPGTDPLAPPGRDRPFWCHVGLPLVNDAYTPLLTCGDLPIGSKICAGWWDTQVTRRAGIDATLS